MFGWILGLAILGFLISLHFFMVKVVTYYIVKDVAKRLGKDK